MRKDVHGCLDLIALSQELPGGVVNLHSACRLIDDVERLFTHAIPHRVLLVTFPGVLKPHGRRNRCRRRLTQVAYARRHKSPWQKLPVLGKCRSSGSGRPGFAIRRDLQACNHIRVLVRHVAISRTVERDIKRMQDSLGGVPRGELSDESITRIRTLIAKHGIPALCSR